MKARITWVQDRMFVGESGSGHTMVLGRADGPDGRTLCPSPMEVLLIGMGGCTAFDVVQILEKGREPIEDCVAELEAERAPTDPKVFTKVHVHFVVTGRGLDPAKVDRAIKLSAEKYCSASIMIGKTATITHDFAIVDPAKSPWARGRVDHENSTFKAIACCVAAAAWPDRPPASPLPARDRSALQTRFSQSEKRPHVKEVNAGQTQHSFVFLAAIGPVQDSLMLPADRRMTTIGPDRNVLIHDVIYRGATSVSSQS